jgi:hypothetical protein
MPASLAHATSPQPADSVRDLWIDVSLGPPLIDWFNQVARPDDIARVEHVRQFDLLDEVTTGRKLLVIRSIEEAERILPSVADQIDIIGYNLEMGQNNLPREQADPVTSVQRMHDLAHEYNLLLAFGPDHDIALSDGAAVAPYVDIFILQVQRVQTEPATVFDFVLPLIPQLRQANPDLEISIQVRTEGNVTQIVDLVDAMNQHLDGVSILTSPETVRVAEALVSELRAREEAAASPPPVTTPPTGEVEPGLSPAAAPEESSLPCPLMVVGAFIAGGIGGGVTAALICASRKGTDGPANDVIPTHAMPADATADDATQIDQL